jgi:tetraprenyl-beta-curcumene synthase
MGTRRRALTATFVSAAINYWSSVYPAICRETRYWHHRATEIPDPSLRRLALQAQRAKRGNIEGAAAFAAFTPRRYRGPTIRAQVAFQSIYDYVDTLAEQPNTNPSLNGKQLHQALLVALDRDAPHPDYYTQHPQREDNGYLREIVDACRSAIGALPSYPSITPTALHLTERIVVYQSLNLSESQGGHAALEPWALGATPPGTGLQWWETAASAGSSLGVFALIAAAAQPTLLPAETATIAHTYWPWIGALHSLLDSLVDQPEDTAAGQHCLLDYYASPTDAASRLQLLTNEAIRLTSTLPNGHQHTIVLTAMVGHYLSALEMPSPTARLIADGVLETMGGLTKAAMLIFDARRGAHRTSAYLQRHAQRRPNRYHHEPAKLDIIPDDHDESDY